MNKPDKNSPNLPLSSVSSEPKHRLVVLVPDSASDVSSAARKIWELADTLDSPVQFLGLCKDKEREPSLKRQIIAMSSVVGGDSKIEFGDDWLTFVKSNQREGDLFVCFGEHTMGFARRPLSQILESSLNATIYVLPEIQVEKKRQSWIPIAASWIGSIAIVVLFFWGQATLTKMPQDWAHTLLLYFSIFAEVGSLWVWNSLI
jgi:hypothetical protein